MEKKEIQNLTKATPRIVLSFDAIHLQLDSTFHSQFLY